MAKISIQRTFSSQWSDYELIDAGDHRKLERWGKVITIRPEKNAYFVAKLSSKQWADVAHFEFIEQSSNKGYWKTLKSEATVQWQISFKNCLFNLHLTKYKHLGIFPEQASNWNYIYQHLKSGDKFLNLFAYTGGSSLVAKTVGGEVYHCDSVKQIICWAKENMHSSGLTDIHWVLEDALKFAQREAKRNNHYKGIIMDPPAYGLGVNKKRWKIEQLFPHLLKAAQQILDVNGFLIINTYSKKLSVENIYQEVHKVFQKKSIEITKLCIKATSGKVLEYGELTRIN